MASKNVSVSIPAVNRSLVIAALVAVVVGFVAGNTVGDSAGYKRGNAEGFEAGNVDGWNRGTEAAVEKAWWDGVVVGCELVFDTTGWEYIFGNTSLGKPTISKDVYCEDNGDHSNTPSFDFPYVAPGN
jgi:hypothetical protein